MLIIIFYGFSMPNLSNLFSEGGGGNDGAADIENFVSGDKNYSGYLTYNVFTPYSSKSIYNLYDNLFYDPTNGNLIVFNDTTKSTSSVFIFNRTNTNASPSYSTYSARDSSGNLVNNSTTESTISTISTSATASWVYKTTDNKYEITYIPFGAETYIHVMKAGKSPSMIMSVFFKDPTSGGTFDYHLWTTSTNTSTVGSPIDIITGTYSGCSVSGCSGDGTNVSDSYYDSSVTLYQVSKYIKYNTTNGDLLIEGTDISGNKILTVYNRNGISTTYTSFSNASTLGGKTPNSSITTLVSNTSIPFMATDKLGMNLIVYWAAFDKSIITLYKRTLDSAGTGVELIKSILITGNSVTATSTTSSSGTSSSSSSSTTCTGTPPPPPATNTSITGVSGEMMMMNDPTLANYFKWFYYWNKMGGDINPYQDSDKYIAKTQIVPPVCPAQNCPSCNCGNTSTCPTCSAGSNTGIGTNTSTSTNTTTQQGGGVISNTIYGTGNLASDSIRNTASFGKTSIENTASFGKEAVVGTASAAKSGIEYVGTGVGNFLGRLTSSNNYGSGSNSGSTSATGGNTGGSSMNTGTSGGVIGSAYRPDTYSYSGAINSQYSGNGTGTGGTRPDPLPVTADFSKFGR